MPNRHFSRLSLITSAAVVAILLAGCAAIEKEDAEDTEQLLSAAGFDIKPADTPDKFASLQAMKQRKVVRRETKDGQLQFLYADAAFCRCLYVGDQRDYQQYEKLAVRQQIAIADQEAALDASMDNTWAYDWWTPY
jgi:hypothetical protein